MDTEIDRTRTILRMGLLICGGAFELRCFRVLDQRSGERGWASSRYECFPIAPFVTCSARLRVNRVYRFFLPFETETRGFLPIALLFGKRIFLKRNEWVRVVNWLDVERGGIGSVSLFKPSWGYFEFRPWCIFYGVLHHIRFDTRFIIGIVRFQVEDILISHSIKFCIIHLM